MDSLTCHSELPCDIGLGVPGFNQSKHDLTTLTCQPSSELCVLDGLRSYLLEASERVLIVRGDFGCHSAQCDNPWLSMSTPSCHAAKIGRTDIGVPSYRTYLLGTSRLTRPVWCLQPPQLPRQPTLSIYFEHLLN
jgi:hypothetical protein